MKKIIFFIFFTLYIVAIYSFTDDGESNTGGSYMICDAKNSNECKITTPEYTIYGTGDGHFGRTQ